MKSAIKIISSIQIIIIIVIIDSSIPKKYHSADLNELIKAICIESFKKELINNKEDIDIDLGNKVCECFVDRINNNETIESAREKCKDDIIREINYKTI